MSVLQTLTLAPIALGIAAILRFIWLDSLRFSDARVESSDPVRVSPATVHRLALQSEAARTQSETAHLPKAA